MNRRFVLLTPTIWVIYRICTSEKTRFPVVFLGIIFSSSCARPYIHTKIVPLSFNFSLLKCVCIIQFRASVLFAWEGLHMRLYCVRVFLLRAGERAASSPCMEEPNAKRETCAAFARSPVYIKRCRARPLIIILYTLLCQRWCCAVIPSTFSLWALQLRLTFSQLKHPQKTHSLTEP
jgi:hypothetical protein